MDTNPREYCGRRCARLWVPIVLIVLALGVAIVTQRGKLEKAYYWFQVRRLDKQVLALEKTGQNTRCARQILNETEWLVDDTRNFKRIAEHLETLRTMLKDPASLNAPDEQSETDGSWGRCYMEWFFKLDASFDEISALDDKHQVPKYRVRFLDRINSPEKLTAHLNNLLTSDLETDGVDRGRELNETIADLLRLVIHHEPENYPYHPQLKETFLNFLMNEARNTETGYWGEWYKTRDGIKKTNGLSLTFHIISYLKGDITDWPKVIDTTLAIKNKRYPNGWLSHSGYANHHNMDVVVLFRYGWNHATPQQQEAIRVELHKMLDWCLKESLQPDGSFRVRDEESLEESSYFGAAFLARLGYFDRTRRFWTDEDFPGAGEAKQHIAQFIRAHLNSGGEGGSYYRDALAELGEKAP
ncbi:MAG TPA: hypothetical protein VL171_16745 [Verrucomicrobiae bacterium]|nr:hypothetical protein [Verrucomicrobiae bacterium]